MKNTKLYYLCFDEIVWKPIFCNSSFSSFFGKDDLYSKLSGRYYHSKNQFVAQLLFDAEKAYMLYANACK